MDLQIPRQVRALLYIFTAFGSLLMGYLAVATEYIGPNESALWFGFCALVSSMAGFNLTPPGLASPPLNQAIPDGNSARPEDGYTGRFPYVDNAPSYLEDEDVTVSEYKRVDFPDERRE